VPGLWLCFTHANCVCNDIVSAANRVVGVVPMPTKAGLAALREARRRLSRRMPHVTPWTRQQVLDKFEGRRRKRYEEAAKVLDAVGLCRKDHARISAFVKSEKFNPAAKRNPDPRMIQARTPEYGLEVARFLKPIEKYLYGLQGPTGLRVIAKGLNQRARAELLVSKMAQFTRPCVISLDASRWDKHVAADVLKIEHDFYIKMCDDPYFRTLLSWQLDNRCSTSNGVKYRVYGGRMSGDMNTALGNCLLMVIMVQAAMKEWSWWDMLDDGDDCLLLVEEELLGRLEADLPKRFLEFGQELKIENVARRVEEVVFCQSRVVCLEDGPIFVRDWRKVLSQSACGVQHWNDPRMVRPMMTAVGKCELALSLGVPVLQEFALALIRNGRGCRSRSLLPVDVGLMRRVKYEVGAESWTELDAIVARPVTPAARTAFQQSWGLSVAEQLVIEGILREWEVATTVAVTYPVEWDARWSSMVALENELPSLL